MSVRICFIVMLGLTGCGPGVLGTRACAKACAQVGGIKRVTECSCECSGRRTEESRDPKDTGGK